MGTCVAVFVQLMQTGKWVVWEGSTEVETVAPMPGTQGYIGEYSARGSALCTAHDKSGGVTHVVELPKEKTVSSKSVLLERAACAEIARGARYIYNKGNDFANGWCSASLQIEQAIDRRSILD